MAFSINGAESIRYPYEKKNLCLFLLYNIHKTEFQAGHSGLCL